MRECRMYLDQQKTKRQIEILADCLEQKKTITTPELAFGYNVEELTIKRDLQDLRSIGINIHSTRKEGVKVEGELAPGIISELLVRYTSINHTNTYLNRSAELLVSKFNYWALVNITKIQHCIDKNLVAKIDYIKNHDEGSGIREVKPLLVFENDGSWRLLTQDRNVTKQYRFDRIKDVIITEKTFVPVNREKIDELFTNSWKSWIGNEKYSVKILLKGEQKDWIESKILIKNQVLSQDGDGNLIFEATVNSLSEITSWVVSRGKGCIVLEPEELKEKVIALAKETLENYNI